MVRETLEVRIDLETGELISAGKAGQAQIDEMKDSFVRTGEAAESFGQKVSRASQKSLRRETAQSAKAARIALTDLGRIVQDLPFGFVAIQNNVDQAGFSIGNLISKAGGGKAALSALGSAIMSPGGVLAILSIASAAFLVFGDDIKAAFKGAGASVADFKKALEGVVDIELDLGSVIIKNVDEAERALSAAQERLDRATARRRRARALAAQPGSARISSAFAQQLNEDINSAQAAVDLFEETIEEFRVARDIFNDLRRDGGVVETELADTGDLEAQLDALINADTTTFSDNISNMRQNAEEQFERMKIAALDVARVFADNLANFDVDTDSIKEIQGLVSEGADQRAQAESEYEESNISRIRTEQEAAAATEAGRKRQLEAVLKADSASIQSGADVLKAVISNVRAILKAKFAEAMGRTLGELPFPANVILGAAASAALSLIFNKLTAGLGGGGGGTSFGGGAAPPTDAGQTFTFGSAPSFSGAARVDNSQVVRELRLTRQAIRDQQFTLRGTDLNLSRTRTNQVFNQMGS